MQKKKIAYIQIKIKCILFLTLVTIDIQTILSWVLSLNKTQCSKWGRLQMEWWQAVDHNSFLIKFNQTWFIILVLCQITHQIINRDLKRTIQIIRKVQISFGYLSRNTKRITLATMKIIILMTLPKLIKEWYCLKTPRACSDKRKWLGITMEVNWIKTRLFTYLTTRESTNYSKVAAE